MQERKLFQKFKIPSKQKAWLYFFGLWFLLLTGVLSHLTGTPGIWQAIQSRNLLFTKQKELQQTEEETQALALEEALLRENAQIQEQEIRRVLGYAAPNELVFDF